MYPKTALLCVKPIPSIPDIVASNPRFWVRIAAEPDCGVAKGQCVEATCRHLDVDLLMSLCFVSDSSSCFRNLNTHGIYLLAFRAIPKLSS